MVDHKLSVTLHARDYASQVVQDLARNVQNSIKQMNRTVSGADAIKGFAKQARTGLNAFNDAARKSSVEFDKAWDFEKHRMPLKSFQTNLNKFTDNIVNDTRKSWGDLKEDLSREPPVSKMLEPKKTVQTKLDEFTPKDKPPKEQPSKYFAELPDAINKSSREMRAWQDSVNQAAESHGHLAPKGFKTVAMFEQLANGTQVARLGFQRLAPTFMQSLKKLLSIQGMLQKIIHYITFSIGVQMVMKLKQGITDIIESFKEFERAITDAVAITGMVGSGFENTRKVLSDLAIELSGTTLYSAVEVSKAFYDIASAGYDVTKMGKRELLPLLQYATATQSDLTTATQSVISTLKSFKMEFSEVSRVVDTFTEAITTSFLTMEKIKEGMKYIGPLAGEMGLSIEETTASMAVLADRGMEGSAAGQRLTMVLTKLLRPADRADDMLSDMGLSLSELDPTTNNFIAILYKLRAAGFDAAASSEMFRARTAAAAITLVRNVDEIARLTAAYEQAAHATKSIAQAQEQTLYGAMKISANAIQAAGLAAAQDLRPHLIEAAQVMRDIMVPAIDILSKILKGILVVFNALKPVLMALIPVWIAMSTIMKVHAFLLGVLSKKTLTYWILHLTLGKAMKAYHALLKIATVLQINYAKALDITTASAKLSNIAFIKTGIILPKVIAALTAFKIALVKTGIGAVIVGIGMLIAILMTMALTSDRSSDSIERMREKTVINMALVGKELTETQKKWFNYYKTLKDYEEKGPDAFRPKMDYLQDTLITMMGDTVKYRPQLEAIAKELGIDFEELVNDKIKKITLAPPLLQPWKGFKDTFFIPDEVFRATEAAMVRQGGVFVEITRFAIGLADEYFNLRDSLSAATAATENQLVANLALQLSQGQLIQVNDDLGITQEIVDRATEKYNNTLTETGNIYRTVSLLSEDYIKAQSEVEKTGRLYLANINSIITAIRSYRDETDVGENEMYGGTLDEWIDLLEDSAKSELRLIDVKDKSILYIQQQTNLVENLSEAMVIYGEGSKEVLDIQNQLNAISKSSVDNKMEEAEIDAKLLVYNSKYQSVINGTIAAEHGLTETERALLETTKGLIDIRQDYIQAENDSLKYAAQRDALNYQQINFAKLYTSKLKYYLEAQEKVFDIELKLYKLRKDTEDQNSDLFDALADQGLLSDEIIDAYIDQETAGSDLLALNFDFMQAYQGLSQSQKEVVQGYLKGEKSLDDLIDAEIENIDIFRDYKEAMDNSSGSIDNFNDLLITTLTGLQEAGVITSEQAALLAELTGKAFESAKAQWELTQSYLEQNDAMDAMIRNTIMLAKSYITGVDGAENLEEVFGKVLVNMGIFSDEGSANANMLNWLVGLFADGRTTLDQFTDSEMMVAATLVQMAKEMGIYTDGMSLAAIMTQLGISTTETYSEALASLVGSAGLAWDGIDDIGTALGNLEDAINRSTKAFKDMADTMLTLFAMTDKELFSAAMMLNFTEFVNGLGDSEDKLLSLTQLMMKKFPDFDLSTVTGDWSTEDWETLYNLIQNAPTDMQNAFKELMGLDLSETFDLDQFEKWFKGSSKIAKANLGKLSNYIKSYPLYTEINTLWDGLPWDSFYNDFYSKNQRTKYLIDAFFKDFNITIPVDSKSFAATMATLAPEQMLAFQRLVNKYGIDLPIEIDDELVKGDLSTLLADLIEYLKGNPVDLEIDTENAKKKIDSFILGPFGIKIKVDADTAGAMTTIGQLPEAFQLALSKTPIGREILYNISTTGTASGTGGGGSGGTGGGGSGGTGGGGGSTPPPVGFEHVVIGYKKIMDNITGIISSSGKQKNITYNMDFAKGMYPIGKGIHWAEGGIAKEAQLGIFGEAGAEALIPLEGKNKKHGYKILQKILPLFSKDVPQYQTGGIIGGKIRDVHGNYEMISILRNINYGILRIIGLLSKFMVNIGKPFLPVKPDEPRYILPIIKKYDDKIIELTEQLRGIPKIGFGVLDEILRVLQIISKNVSLVVRAVNINDMFSPIRPDEPRLRPLPMPDPYEKLLKINVFAEMLRVLHEISKNISLLTMKVNLPRWDDLINLTTISNLLTKYPPEVVISWAGHKKGTITKGPELSMIGEAGAEAVIPLEGSNKKYGKTLMQHILPKYFPDMVGFRQQGGIIGGGSYDYSTANNENYTIAGPININSVANADDFLQQLKFKMRSSK